MKLSEIKPGTQFKLTIRLTDKLSVVLIYKRGALATRNGYQVFLQQVQLKHLNIHLFAHTINDNGEDFLHDCNIS